MSAFESIRERWIGGLSSNVVIFMEHKSVLIYSLGVVPPLRTKPRSPPCQRPPAGGPNARWNQAFRALETKINILECSLARLAENEKYFGSPSTLDSSKVVAPPSGVTLYIAPFGVAHINLEQYRED